VLQHPAANVTRDSHNRHIARLRLGQLGNARHTEIVKAKPVKRIFETIVERVKAGMRRAKLEGRRIGRAPLDINREQVVRDRRAGMSLSCVARKHKISSASVCRLMKEAKAELKVEVISSQHDPVSHLPVLESAA
jgi:hypothetical protein